MAKNDKKKQKELKKAIKEGLAALEKNKTYYKNFSDLFDKASRLEETLVELGEDINAAQAFYIQQERIIAQMDNFRAINLTYRKEIEELSKLLADAEKIVD